ncbi:MAG TPA: M1 family aminopeptidase [Gemmatimonadales bacterium]|nr:M1 family aminopeptidase [Gemmatimonadales bacterium]
MTLRRPAVPALLAAALGLAAPLAAQAPHPAAQDIGVVLSELEAMRPQDDSSFAVRNILLTHDVATLTLGQGRVWPLTPVNGRVVGVVYQGSGRLRFTAPSPVERERMREYLGQEELDEPITSAVLFFADGTYDTFGRLGISSERVEAPGDLTDRIGRARDYLKTYKDRTWDAGFLEPILNGRENGMFFALIQREHGEELILQIDPDATEPIHLGVHRQGAGADVDPEWVTQFAWTDRPAPPRDQRRRQVAVDRYVLDVNMPQTIDGGVNFITHARATLHAPEGGYGPWIPFLLFPELDVDSARWGDVPIPAYKNDDAYYVWVRAPEALPAGTTPTLDLWYHGDLLARYGDWFVLKDASGWYPRPVDALAKAAFDITYHTPLGHPIGSVGTLTDSATAGRVVTTHWVHETPIRNAGFNVGRFKTYVLQAPGVPPVTLLWSDAGHRAIARDFGVAPQAHVRETITDEAASAVKFFTNVYGAPLEPQFYATEIPQLHGEAFPGLIHYSFATFLPNAGQQVGFDQVFRAHEVAHQWWGIGVDYASYRDRWLSEGLAEFSGLWYLQTRTGSLDKYLGFLREYRTNLVAAREHLGATSLGHRTGTGRFPQYYTYGVYQKGAWVAHMLRVLMLQLSTMNEDRFTDAMREFYTTYQGRSASTDDLRRVMEKHAGADLRWFFDEWIDGTGLPTYAWAWQATPGANGQQVVHLRVRQSHVPDSFMMYVPVTVTLQDGRALRTRILVRGPESTADLPPLPGQVKQVSFNDFEGVLAEVREESW